MVAATHISTSVLIISIPLLFGVNSHNYMLIILSAALGSLIPDRIEPLFVLKHRGVSHNLLIYLLFLIIALALFYKANIIYFVGFFLGSIIAILMDCMSISGVKGALFPITNKDYVLKILPLKYSYKVGSTVEFIIFFVSSALFLYIYINYI